MKFKVITIGLLLCFCNIVWALDTATLEGQLRSGKWVLLFGSTGSIILKKEQSVDKYIEQAYNYKPKSGILSDVFNTLGPEQEKIISNMMSKGFKVVFINDSKAVILPSTKGWDVILDSIAFKDKVPDAYKPLHGVFSNKVAEKQYINRIIELENSLANLIAACEKK